MRLNQPIHTSALNTNRHFKLTLEGPTETTVLDVAEWLESTELRVSLVIGDTSMSVVFPIGTPSNYMGTYHRHLRNITPDNDWHAAEHLTSGLVILPIDHLGLDRRPVYMFSHLNTVLLEPQPFTVYREARLLSIYEIDGQFFGTRPQPYTRFKKWAEEAGLKYTSLNERLIVHGRPTIHA
jgi:hypothetical protein